jgi:hypothetical protein
MKTSVWASIVFFMLAAPVFAQTNTGVEITNLLWKMNDAVISDACVKDNVRITFDTAHIPWNGRLTVCIFEKNDNGMDDLVTEITCPAKEYNALHWAVEFDETGNTTSAKELKENGFTIPEYYFIVTCGEYTSGKSNSIKVYGSIDIKLVDETTKKVLSNRPYRIYFGNGTKHEGTSDGDGRIVVRNAVIGERYIMVGDEE